MKRAAVLACGVVLLTVVLYAPSRHFGFVALDDPAYVTANPVVGEGLTLRGALWAFTSVGDAGNWHPLTWISHMADVSLFGIDAGRHHIVSVLIHAAAAAVLLLALNAATGSLWAPAFAAALFAVHPLHVESVAWVSERKDVLAAFFGFAALAVWVRYARRPATGPYLTTLALASLGLLAKPTLVTLPVVLLILDWWPLGRWPEVRADGVLRGGGRRRVSLLLLEKLPLLALAAGAAALTWTAQERAGAFTLMDAGHRPLRYANALLSFVRYVGKALWPAGLAVSYPYPTVLPPGWQLAGAAGLLAAVTAAALLLRRRAPWLGAGWGWYVVTLLPMAGFIKVGGQALADRYSYLPLTGLFLALAWSLRAWARRAAPGAGRAVPVLAGLLPLLALLPLTSRQLATWRSTETLFARLSEVAPDSFWVRADREYRLGFELARAGRHEAARRHLEAALRERPQMPEAHNTLGGVFFLEGDLEAARRHFAAALSINPAAGPVHENMALTLRRLGRDRDALIHEREAARLAVRQGTAGSGVPR